MKKLPLLLLAGLLALIVAACTSPVTPDPTAVPQATLAPEPTVAPEPEMLDIVDTAVADGRFTTLVAAVQAAGLVDTLKSEGPFTVFAPTDDAFAALPAGTVEALLADIPTLTNILLYHVVPGKVMAADVLGLDSAATALAGADISIMVDGDSVKINDATVLITDIETTNGVIHVIDSVILPPSGM
ncbi:MAG: fasciclin domain-containing protein [Caldilineales bacterium]|nr:fasciclin domain-containing protein [Caldilineales bacterium]